MEKKITKKQASKIAIIGPESTGKTTLTKDLTTAMNGVCVEEYARVYLEDKTGYILKDLITIAKHQLRLEKEAEVKAKKQYVFCDTNLLVIIIWAKYMFDEVPDILKKLYQPQDFLVHVLCKPDIPWEPDPLREHPHERDEILKFYETFLKSYKIPYLVVSGERDDRVEQVKAFLES